MEKVVQSNVSSAPKRGSSARQPFLEAEVLRATADFQGARSLGELSQSMVQASSRILQGDLVYIQHFHMRTGKANTLTPNIPWPFDKNEQDACTRLFFRHPLVAVASSTRYAKISDVLCTRTWRNATMYNEVFRRNRFDYHGTIHLPVDAQNSCAVVVMRSGFDFTNNEYRACSILHRMAVPAFYRILRMERARAELSLLAGGADELGLGIIHLNPDGRADRLSSQAAHLLQDHGGQRGPKPLLTTVNRWLARPHNAGGPPSPLHLRTPLGKLQVRPSIGRVAGGGFLFLDELERYTPPPVYEAAGLSRRESEVLQAMVEGSTDAQTAARLCIGLRTVHEYVTRIFNKTGVSNRQSAVTWARRLRRGMPVVPTSTDSPYGLTLSDPLQSPGSSMAFLRQASM